VFILSRCLCLDLTSYIPEISSSFLMISLLILPSLVMFLFIEKLKIYLRDWRCPKYLITVPSDESIRKAGSVCRLS
jgi:hypothetical protein